MAFDEQVTVYVDREMGQLEMFPDEDMEIRKVRWIFSMTIKKTTWINLAHESSGRLRDPSMLVMEKTRKRMKMTMATGQSPYRYSFSLPRVQHMRYHSGSGACERFDSAPGASPSGAEPESLTFPGSL